MAGIRVRRVDFLRRRLVIAEALTEVAGRIEYGTPKTHQQRTVPLPADLVEPLARRCEGKTPDDLLMTAPGGTVLRLRNWRRSVFDPAVRAAGLTDVTPHDLRHTAASLAVASGAHVKLVQRMLGHASAAMTLDVYAALFDDDLGALAERMDAATAAHAKLMVQRTGVARTTTLSKRLVSWPKRAQDGAVLSRRAQLVRLRQVALAALCRYPLADGRLTFVAHGENTTYRHDGADGSHLVRVHRPQRHGRGVDSMAAIGSEIAWLQAIRADTGLAVPEPVAARDGALTIKVAAAGEERVCSVLRWMDGRIHESSARPVHLRRLGEAMASLHDQADAWTPPPDFVRIRWDHETFFGNVMVYGETPAAECWELLPGEVRARFKAVEARMVDLIPSAGGTGLIHADLHLGNALFHRGAVKLIDFDDCGTGPRLYELAVALWELRDGPDYPAFREALLAGYRTRRDVNERYLDDFIALRQVAFDLWYTGTAQVNSAFSQRLDVVHRWSLAMLDLVEAS